jgi:hypothetical protein
MLRTEEDEEEDLLADAEERRDRVFAQWMAFPHLI